MGHIHITQYTMPLFNYSVLFIKDLVDDVKTFIIYNNKTFTVLGTRKRLSTVSPPVINESDQYCDFYMTFHETNYSGLLTFMSLLFDKFRKNVELGVYSINMYPEQIESITIQDIYSYITTENEIFGYDKYSLKNKQLDNILRMIIYDEVSN
jgi:hypothetical protein